MRKVCCNHFLCSHYGRTHLASLSYSLHWKLYFRNCQCFHVVLSNLMKFHLGLNYLTSGAESIICRITEACSSLYPLHSFHFLFPVQSTKRECDCREIHRKGSGLAKEKIYGEEVRRKRTTFVRLILFQPVVNDERMRLRTFQIRFFAVVYRCTQKKLLIENITQNIFLKFKTCRTLVGIRERTDFRFTPNPSPPFWDKWKGLDYGL